MVKNSLFLIRVHFFLFKGEIIFAEPQLSYSKTAVILNFAQTQPVFYAFRMLGRVVSFTKIQLFVTSPVHVRRVSAPKKRKSELNCLYKEGIMQICDST